MIADLDSDPVEGEDKMEAGSTWWLSLSGLIAR
jgi:hypothetical protein